MIRYPCSPPPPAQHVPPPPKGPLPSIPLSFLPSVSSHNVARMLLYQLIFKRLLFRNTAARALLCLVPDGLVQTATRCSFPSTRFAKVKGKKEKKKRKQEGILALANVGGAGGNGLSCTLRGGARGAATIWGKRLVSHCGAGGDGEHPSQAGNCGPGAPPGELRPCP